ncbi:MAG TPA: DUF3775 domain-containing protein [Alphaproteobacteria bacterium]|nr:DUF3775 domain-containing protein [Alphaproteobacteria bacterium]
MSDEMKRPEIDTETVCRIVVKAREFDAKEGAVEEEPGSNPSDEQFREVLEDFADDPVYQELKTFIDDLDIDDQCELVALMWIGRGDFKAEDWAQASAQARQRHTKQTSEYLLGTPLLADYLEEGLAQFGESCLGFEIGRL